MPPHRTSVEVVDADFKYVKEVPVEKIVHRPSTRMNIARLVFCRNYRPCEAGSCAMGDGCKFVHADVELESLESHPIHVKYAWRSEELCTYPRLPAGRVLSVAAPNNRPPVEEIPSEQILVTQGALNEDPSAGPLSHCAHYYFNRMCNRGERCNFIHAVHVDPTILSDFERVSVRHVVSSALLPGKRRGAKGSKAVTQAMVPSEEDCVDERTKDKDDSSESKNSVAYEAVLNRNAEEALGKCDKSRIPNRSADDDDDEDVAHFEGAHAAFSRRCTSLRFRRDPYSFKSVTVPV